MEKDIKLEYIIEEKCAEMKGIGINEPEFAFMHPTTYINFTNTFMSRTRFMVVGPEKPTRITHFQCMYGKVELIQSFQVEEGDVKIMGRAIIENSNESSTNSSAFISTAEAMPCVATECEVLMNTNSVRDAIFKHDGFYCSIMKPTVKLKQGSIVGWRLKNIKK